MRTTLPGNGCQAATAAQKASPGPHSPRKAAHKPSGGYLGAADTVDQTFLRVRAFGGAWIQSLLLLVATAFFPIYMFDSGGLQISHILLALFFCIALSSRTVAASGWALMILAISVYSFIVEGFYIGLGADPSYLFNPVYFLYNFLVAATVYKYVCQHGMAPISYGTVISAVIVMATLLFGGVQFTAGENASRAVGTFNNPNQLGYFSVCLVSLTYLSYRCRYITYWFALAIILVCVVMAILSLSKSAILAIFPALFFVSKPVNSRNGMILWMLGVLSVCIYALNKYFAGAFDKYLFLQRIENLANENDSSLAHRGYLAILEGNPLQFIFGMGSENIKRIVGLEVHSTIGNIANTYGMLGAILIIALLSIWGKKIYHAFGFTGFLCIFCPPMLYGVMHNGARFTIFWLLIAVSLGMAHKEARR